MIRPPRRPFIKGPIDLEWVRRAGRLPGRALLVGLHLHYLVGLTRQKTVRINLSELATIGIHRATLARGLGHLEQAHLVSVKRSRGACACVTVLDVR